MLLGVAALLAVQAVRAEVSIYPLPQPTQTPGAPYTGWQAYDPTPLQDPPLPNPAPPNTFDIVPESGAQGLGHQLPGSYMGVSIEMSLAEAIIGPNATWLRPQFLNLMSVLKDRGGPPTLRLGGNTQEKAKLLDVLPNGGSTDKIAIGPTGYTNTPTLLFTLDIIHALRASSDLLGIKWWIGIPMNDTNPPRLEIAEQSEPILGEFLAGYQVGNEPDLYVNHDYRQEPYDQNSYIAEFDVMTTAIQNDPLINYKTKVGGPGVCCLWPLNEMLEKFQFLDKFSSRLNALIIEHYPIDNCIKGQNDPQTMMNQFMMHSHPQSFANLYKEAVGKAQAVNLPVVLLETNTASCNGFLGLSDGFAAALWITDLGLQLASISFSNVMVHLGGQAAYYNPFVPPPHNATKPFMWTVGPPWYAILFVAEALGQTGTAQVADLGANGGNVYTPAYVIYENGQPARVALINYMSDPSGGHDYTARIQTSAPQVKVRYLIAPQVSSKIPNITWAGQTFGSYFESDGLPRGEHKTETVPCTGGFCSISVPAPGAALVFLTDSAYSPNDDMVTYASSHITKMHNTAAVEPGHLYDNNGLNGKLRSDMKDSSTSSQQKKNAGSAIRPSWAVAFVAIAGGLFFLGA